MNSSIELLLTICPKTIRNTTWMNLSPNLESARDLPENRNLKNVFPIPQKPTLPKKFKININLISNALSMVYVKFHNMKQKKNF